MGSLPHQISGLISPQISPTKSSNKIHSKRVLRIKAAVIIPGVSAVKDPSTIERARLKEMFKNAYERCHTTPMDGLAFTLDDFHAALEKYEFNYEVGTKVKGTVFRTDDNGALVDIMAKSSAYLPLQEASLHNINHVEEAGIVPGMREEFVVIGVNESDDSLVLSLRAIQHELAWERCRQLQAEDVVVKGKVVSANSGGVVTVIEGLRGFIPFSQISTKSSADDLLEKELPLKFVEVDEEQSKLVLSNRKALSDSQEQLGIGSVVLGTVQIMKPYGAFIDIGGINGLLHISQITHARVSDIKTVLQPGDILKVMILRHDRERGRVSLSTKKLEPTPGDMIRNPKLVFEKAEEMARAFRQRIAQAEAMARADLSGSTLSSDGILDPLTSKLPGDDLDLPDIPPADSS